MKPYLLSSLLLFSASSFAQTRIYTGYSLGIPKQQMADNIKALHSLNLGFALQPKKIPHLQTGLDLSWGAYASERKEQTFTFSNGTTTRTCVNYGSNVTQASVSAKYLLTTKKAINPYIGGKIGYTSFYSTLFIEDPADPMGCRALVSKNLISDGTFSGAMGAGLQVDWKLFGRETGGENYLDISVNHIRGGNVNYINTKRLYDAVNPPTNSEGKPLNVQFINASTQEIHEHQVAEVYTTPLRMLEFKVTAVFTLRRYER